MTSTTSLDTTSGYIIIDPKMFLTGSIIEQLNPKLFSAHVNPEPSAPPADLADKEVTDEPSAKQEEVERYVEIRIKDGQSSSKYEVRANTLTEELKGDLEAFQVKIDAGYDKKIDKQGKAVGALGMFLVGIASVTAIIISSLLGCGVGASLVVPTTLTALAIGVVAIFVAFSVPVIVSLGITAVILGVTGFVYNINCKRIEANRKEAKDFINRIKTEVPENEDYAKLQKLLNETNVFHAEHPEVIIERTVGTITV